MGNFIISLDFELIWGIIDLPLVNSYKDNIRGVQTVIPKLLDLADKYDIKLTFGIVGFIYYKNKEQLLCNIPKLKPSYKNKKLSPYESYISLKCSNDYCHFSPHLIDLIRQRPQHEIASHTYCHYYCLESGQSIDEFKTDLNFAIQIAKENGINVKSLIFPRNQCNDDYLIICKQFGIECYRGNEFNSLHQPSNHTFYLPNKLKRFLRLLDTYLPISGNNSYSKNEMSNNIIINIPASRFFRPYSKSLFFLEYFKMKRILKEMEYAAKNDKTYHLWFHPHNIGINQEYNFNQIEQIFKQHNLLCHKYNFNSKTMLEVSKYVKNEK